MQVEVWMRRSRWIVVVLATCGSAILLCQLPFIILKRDYARVDRAVAEGRSIVLEDREKDRSFCFVGPQAFAVATARDKFSDYWLDPLVSDFLIDSTSSWTLVIASRWSRIVSFKTSQIEGEQRFPEEIVCADALHMRLEGGEWVVKAGAGS